MEREILFKAKRLDNSEWVIGTYHYSADGKYHYIMRREKFLERDGSELALHYSEVNEVIPETVCQLVTNHESQNVFEGDILRTINHYEGINPYYLYHVIVWSEKYCCYLAKTKENHTNDIGNGTVQIWVYFKNANSLEITGNIHD